jgi:hypothetical protein
MQLPALVVTSYCERSSQAFWAEPLNALSNIGFLLVASILLRRLWRDRYPLAGTWDIWLLSLLTGVTGIGSFLWHTVATPWAQWMDVIPILMYISVYLPSFLLRVARTSVIRCCAWFAAFNTLNILFVLTIPGNTLNGSIYYLPGLMMLFLLGRFERRIHLSTALFTVALVFRSIDRALCPEFPIGTHFLWHLFISLTVYFTTLSLLNSSPNRLQSKP